MGQKIFTSDHGGSYTKSMTPEARYAKYTETNRATSCVEWTASVTGTGYPIFTVDRKPKTSVRRWAYERWVEPIPEGYKLFAQPTCAPRCVNPRHMVPQSHAYHMRVLHRR